MVYPDVKISPRCGKIHFYFKAYYIYRDKIALSGKTLEESKLRHMQNFSIVIENKSISLFLDYSPNGKNNRFCWYRCLYPRIYICIQYCYISHILILSCYFVISPVVKIKNFCFPAGTDICTQNFI